MLKFNKKSALEALRGGTLDVFFNAHFKTAMEDTVQDPQKGIFQLQALLAIFEDEQLKDQRQHWEYQAQLAYHLGEIHDKIGQKKEACQYFKQSIDIDFAYEALPHPFTFYQYVKNLEADYETLEKAYIQYMAVATKHSGEMSEDLGFAMEDSADFYAQHQQKEKALELYNLAKLIYAKINNQRLENILTKIQGLIEEV